MSIIRDPSLAPIGIKKIEWVKNYMPVLRQIEQEFIKEKPFTGMRIAVSIHLEAKTAYLAKVLSAGGAEVAVTGSNVLSTKDDICAGLAAEGYTVYAWHGATEEEYWSHLKKTLSFKPHIIIDDGGDFVGLLHGECAEYRENLLGGCEETTTGISRLKAWTREGKLKFPMMAVNDADSKHLFDNVHGTGQSVWDAIMYTTNVMLTGRVVVVAGYGYCGRGVAARAKGLGADVVVTEVDPVCALEALMDGYRVMPMDEAAPIGDFFITVTGCNRVITARHLERMRDGVILCNAGHFDVEIDKNDLNALAVEVIDRRLNIQGFRMADGRILNLLAEGRLVNLASGNGHPAEIMDMSFAIQALCLRYLSEHGAGLSPGVYDVPADIDGRVGRVKLAAMGMKIDTLTEEQEAYLAAY